LGRKHRVNGHMGLYLIQLKKITKTEGKGGENGGGYLKLCTKGTGASIWDVALGGNKTKSAKRKKALHPRENKSPVGREKGLLSLKNGTKGSRKTFSRREGLHSKKGRA